jgi:hypothetical protein
MLIMIVIFFSGIRHRWPFDRRRPGGGKKKERSAPFPEGRLAAGQIRNVRVLMSHSRPAGNRGPPRWGQVFVRHAR